MLQLLKGRIQRHQSKSFFFHLCALTSLELISSRIRLLIRPNFVLDGFINNYWQVGLFAKCHCKFNSVVSVECPGDGPGFIVYHIKLPFFGFLIVPSDVVVQEPVVLMDIQFVNVMTETFQ